jgi:TRAP-type C4-dicarboxylate transport system substrate-binding protein
MNKQKWNSLPPDVQKIISEFSADFISGWGAEWNKVDIEGRDFFTKLGGRVISLSDAEGSRWVNAIEPMFGDFKKDLVSKGFTAGEVDNMISYVKERIEYWKAQEKAQKIPTAYQY